MGIWYVLAHDDNPRHRTSGEAAAFTPPAAISSIHVAARRHLHMPAALLFTGGFKQAIVNFMHRANSWADRGCFGRPVSHPLQSMVLWL